MAENSAETAPKRRVIGRPFVKGAASPNPGGRTEVLPDVLTMFLPESQRINGQAAPDNAHITSATAAAVSDKVWTPEDEEDETDN